MINNIHVFLNYKIAHSISVTILLILQNSLRLRAFNHFILLKKSFYLPLVFKGQKAMEWNKHFKKIKILKQNALWRYKSILKSFLQQWGWLLFSEERDIKGQYICGIHFSIIPNFGVRKQKLVCWVWPCLAGFAVKKLFAVCQDLEQQQTY